MTKIEGDPADFSPEDTAEAEEAAAWLHDRITERLAVGLTTVVSMRSHLEAILSTADLTAITVEPGDASGTLRVIVPKRMVEVIAAFRAAGKRRMP